MSGWVKLHRSLLDHWLFDFKEPDKALAWIDLVMSANHKNNSIKIKGTVINIDRGQLAKSQITLQKRWGWSQNKVKRFLKLLEKEGMIALKTDALTTLITICKYNEYQDNASADERTDERPHERSPNVQANDKQECKKEEERKKKEHIAAMFDLFWDAGMRKDAKQGAAKKFNSLARKQNGSLENWTNNLITDIKQRLINEQFGFNNMLPTTYLNGERWNDEQYKRPSQPSKQCTQDILAESRRRDQEQMRDFMQRTFTEDNAGLELDGGDVRQQVAAPVGAIDGEWTADGTLPKLVRKD